jgi:putative membrane protein
MMHDMWSWGGTGTFGMVVFWGVLVVAVGLLVRWIGGQTGQRVAQPHPTETALEILKKRYARGEISRNEFDEMRRALDSQKGVRYHGD